ncbi:CLUMA_CG009285, isoform A [Clunio marinus]|uniref:CLUMA_CG009285, isoform A n=1 Tax=Clunio marinus TaxID=568069 RepID=A0A1J1I8E3_9DIPT|nr:CLUMA_CG009285, isoform A [Clunio marinus]
MNIVHPSTSSVNVQQNRRRSSQVAFNLVRYNLNREEDRRKTFEQNGWFNHEFNVEYKDLALLGFFYEKYPDSVRCNFCLLQLSDFEPGDDILQAHLTFSPNCPLLKRCKTDNEPMNSEKLNKILPKVYYDECGWKRKKNKEEVKKSETIRYPRYESLNKRLETFDMWPIGLKQKPQDLAEAGFFYSGQSDVTICFSCGNHIGKWEVDDNPWVEHNKLSKECNFLKENKEILNENTKKYETDSDYGSMETEDGNDEKNTSEDKIIKECKICLEVKRLPAILPCGHVAACQSCIQKLTNKKCPICRTKIEDTKQLYLS